MVQLAVVGEGGVLVADGWVMGTAGRGGGGVSSIVNTDSNTRTRESA